MDILSNMDIIMQTLFLCCSNNTNFGAIMRMELYLWLSLTWYFLMYFLMMFGLSTACQN